MVYTRMRVDARECVEIGPNDWTVCWRFGLGEISGYFKRDVGNNS